MLDGHEKDNLPHSEVPLVKIKFPLPAKDASGVDAEWLWAEPESNGHFVVRNVPFLVNGFSFGDTVRAKFENECLVFDGVVSHSGHSTYRIYAKAAEDNPGLQALCENLAALHCEFERANNKLLGIDVLPAADIYAVYACLDSAERSGILEFDEGHCGHPLRPEET
jgi:hypothetical protein